ncbi:MULTISPECIES: chromate efflux transporter [Bacteroidota]|jgi:chromate transporter|uniref:Chromate transporter n=4 Tax=Bacteroidota TaxID=976 RepID=A0A1X7J7Z7_9SPHI|nr:MULTISPECIES: chromate efflux transporter [Bacteroidota]EHM7982873.1 chromate efflux transporter [Elizabethkingia anophelis]EHM8030120.1 chromate efflux transporter [Elizabethkingia anophelis]EHZ9532874.1 chromate efflux transporter [Elizabethkingia anophelis]EKU3670784.1 chromate efflux transporter [Elizabethkingia anophelis]EKU4208528.1 chromate efflux transporter [Elizabethkingia anophelis]
MERDIQIKEIAKLFLKLGFIGFGGPAVHIAMMQQEVVVKKKWMSEQHFLDLLGATNLIPGPNSTEMAIHIGYDKGGWKGLIFAGLCFILPAVFITGIFAWLYQQYGQLPEVQPFIYGIKPAIIAIIIGAVFPLAKKSVKSTFLAVVGILVLVLSLFGISEIYLMFGAGLLAMALYYLQDTKNTLQSFIPLAFLQIAQSPLLSETNTKLFWIFLKIGAILYGSGYVLFAFLDTELVATGLLTRQQLMDAIAVGQFTPGPVFSSVTFIGYQINGLSGAVISTIAIFLPSFILVALLNPLMKKMRQSKGLSIFLDAVNVASVAIIAAICLTIGKETITDWRTILIAMISAIVVFKFKKINSAFVVIGGALLGYLFNLI